MSGYLSGESVMPTSGRSETELEFRFPESMLPLWRVVEPMLKARDWSSARLYLQKVGYSAVSAPQQEKDDFRAFMTAFARHDPLYTRGMAGVLPVLKERPEGTPQTQLYAHMGAAGDVEQARYILYFAEQLGAVRRVKKGNSYIVFDATPALAPFDWNATYQKALSEAFDTVTATFTGVTKQGVLAAVKAQVLEQINDRRGSSRMLLDALAGDEWYWPAWQAQAAVLGCDEAPAPVSEAPAPPLECGLDHYTATELKAILTQHGARAPSRARKADLVATMVQLPASAWHDLAQTGIAAQRDRIVIGGRREMAQRACSRIDAIAREAATRAQLMDSRPHLRYWRFVAGENGLRKPPPRCAKLHNKIVEANVAATEFPVLPCDRLDCGCRITATTSNLSGEG